MDTHRFLYFLELLGVGVLGHEHKVVFELDGVGVGGRTVSDPLPRDNTRYLQVKQSACTPRLDTVRDYMK